VLCGCTCCGAGQSCVAGQCSSVVPIPG
jgi:hypothetical protein